MTFTAIVNHTFFLMREHEGLTNEPYEIKAEAQIHGEIFREYKVNHSHIIIVKLDSPIEGYRFAKIDRFNFALD